MTRPPRPEPAHPLRTELVIGESGLDYLPLDFQALVALAARVGGGTLTPGDGDPTKTLYELSALVAHVLAVHQDHYASEAFLGTAATARSLVRHGRRLAYEPSPGSTATGYLEIHVNEGLTGELPANLVAATSPRGGRPAQDFETAVARYVEAAWNRVEVREADRETVVETLSTTKLLRIAGTGHEFRAGDPTILVGPTYWAVLDVVAVHEVEREGPDEPDETVLTLSHAVGVAFGTANDPKDYRVLSRPAVEARLFGWNADPVLFPATKLESSTTYADPGGALGETTPPTHGYEQPSGTTVNDIFLASPVDSQLLGQHVLAVDGTMRNVARVTAQRDNGVRFTRGGTREEIDHVDVSDTSVTPVMKWVVDRRSISATVTHLALSDVSAAAMSRAAVRIRSTLFGAWRLTVPLVSREASKLATGPDTNLFLAGEHSRLEPGMLVALITRNRRRRARIREVDVDVVGNPTAIDLAAMAQAVGVELVDDTARGTEEVAQIVELTDVEVLSETTRVQFRHRTPVPHVGGTPHTWQLGNLAIAANVVPIIHGTTREEILGDSDGVTPFQRYKLKKVPLAQIPSGTGLAPDLEVRVGGVRWDRVPDFGVPVATARNYKLEREHDGTTWVRFGDGRVGAVPPAARITARYRVGLGSAGNVDAGRIARLTKNHPLVDRVTNPVATGGGTEPASLDDVRVQATRYIRTFDRAVSVGDHADLALLFPGVARATARFVDGTIELVAATAEGAPLPNRDKLFEFIDARRDTALRLVPVDPVAIPIVVRLYIEIDEAFLLRDVEDAIRAALYGESTESPGMFTFAARDLGQAAHASEVHARISRVAGVTYGQLIDFDLAPNTELRDVLQPRPHQWLRLDAASLTFAPPSEGDHD